MNMKVWNALCDVLFIFILLLLVKVMAILYGGDW